MLEEYADLRGRPAGAVEDLTPCELGGELAFELGEQIAVDVSVAGTDRVMQASNPTNWNSFYLP